MFTLTTDGLDRRLHLPHSDNQTLSRALAYGLGTRLVSDDGYMELPGTSLL